MGTTATTDVTAFYAALAHDLLQHYARGPVTIAVTGPDADAARRVADALGSAITDAGRTIVRASGRGDEPDALRDGVITPFRAGGDRVLVVDGPQLLRPAILGAWNASLWLEGGPTLEGAVLDSERAYVRDRDPRGAATAVLDVTDPSLPRRVFSDSC